MTPVEYVVLKGWQYRKRGAWLDVKRCPFCMGGKNSDLHTFAVHATDGNYICKRGSCNVSGSFAGLMENFGDKATKQYKQPEKVKQTYRVPTTRTVDPAETVVAYLSNVRGFSESTINTCGVKSDAEGNVVFEYFDTSRENQLCMAKFRKPRKTGQGEKKAWREKDGKDVLWMLEKSDPSKGPLVIFFGEYDAMTGIEAGIPNCTSVPSGDDSLDWIKNDWQTLESYTDIVIWGDDDESGQRAVQEVSRRLGTYRIRLVESMFKDANETLYRLEKQDDRPTALETIREMVASAPSFPYESLIRLVDVPDESLSKDGILSGIPELDRITGGFRGGELTLWSGDNHAGKTTGVLGICGVEAVNQEIPTFVYSGEMKKSKIKYWFELMAAGPDYVAEKVSPRTGATYWEVAEPAKWPIRNWYSDLIHLYDKQGGTSEENLFDAMEFAYRKFGCRNFILDNLMIMVLSMTDAKDEYHRQASFTKHCKQFADDFDVHVHLVAHGKKGGDPNMPPTKSDVKGASEITNLVDNAGAFWRVPEAVRTGDAFKNTNPKWIPDVLKDLDGVSTLINWFKTRDSGEIGDVRLCFDQASKRFASAAHPGSLRRPYKWEQQMSPFQG